MRASVQRAAGSLRMLARAAITSLGAWGGRWRGRVEQLTPLPPAEHEHLFEFTVAELPGPVSVHVAGDFNGWSRAATPMVRCAQGVYRATVTLPEGVYHYKFLVNGSTWLNDPRSDVEFEQPDGHGGRNSAVLVGVDPRQLPPPRPGAILESGLRHHPGDSRDCNVVSASLVRLAVRVRAGEVGTAAVLLREAHERSWRRQPLTPMGRPPGFERLGAVVTVSGPHIRYLFELCHGRAKVYFASGRSYGSLWRARKAAYSCEMRVRFETPAWAREAVWYQIFPERFRNGEPANDPVKTQRWQSAWFSRLPGESGRFQFDVVARRFGGDLQGIRQQLPYLRELGVNAIYLNPIFKAQEAHKYDTHDHRHVDDHFGVKSDPTLLVMETDDPATWQWTASDRLFLDFVAEAHRQGFKVIIDGVFNHVGRGHWAFQDVLRNRRSSKFADWFDIVDWAWPLRCSAWDGPVGSMPTFHKDEKLGLARGPREHVLAIARRWLAPDGDPSRGVDGFRLDVPADIPHPFWREFRQLVKQIKGDALICGELWGPAGAWLQGDQFDGVMNYPLAVAIHDFFANEKKATRPSEFAAVLEEIIHRYPLQASLVNLNLLDSHDTDRFASMLVNPDRAYDTANRAQGRGESYSIARPTELHWQRMRQAVVFQMSFLGSPMIYYGDEAGMWSPDDPSNRQPMVWRDLEPYDDSEVRFSDEMFRHYQRMIAIRGALAPLRLGALRVMMVDDARGLIAFERAWRGERVYVVLNRSAEARTVKLPVADEGRRWTDWLDEGAAEMNRAISTSPDARPVIRALATGMQAEGGKLRVRLGPYGSAVLAPS